MLEKMKILIQVLKNEAKSTKVIYVKYKHRI